MRAKLMAILAAAATVGALSVRGDPIWPIQGAWTVLTVAGSPYIDLHGAGDAAWSSPNPDQLDLVGGVDANSVFYPTAYWATDGTNLMFRIRSDNPWDPHRWVYTALLNTDGDDSVDWLLQWDDKTDDRVELGLATGTASGPGSATPWGSNNDIQNSGAAQIAVGPESIWARGLDATILDGSQFHNTNANDNDAFLDFAVPLTQFLMVTGLNAGDPFSVAFGTAPSHIVLGSDKPDYTIWSDPISVVPEPASGLLLGLAAAALLLRQRRRSA